MPDVQESKRSLIPHVTSPAGTTRSTPMAIQGDSEYDPNIKFISQHVLSHSTPKYFAIHPHPFCGFQGWRFRAADQQLVDRAANARNRIYEGCPRAGLQVGVRGARP